MAQSFENAPKKASTLGEKAPFLGKWLWLLFWMVIPQALASLLNSDLFGPEPVFRYTYLFVPQYVIRFLGILLQVIYYLGYGLALLKLSSAVDRYRTAAICCLVSGAISLLSFLLPALTSGDGLPLLLGFMNLIGGIIMMVGEYQEYMGHSELLEDVDIELSDKWRKLWKWYMISFGVLLGSVVFLIIGPILGLLAALAGGVGLVVVVIIKLVYLYRTAMIFRFWS